MRKAVTILLPVQNLTLSVLRFILAHSTLSHNLFYSYDKAELGDNGVELLESTGEGVHIYDINRRLFESDEDSKAWNVSKRADHTKGEPCSKTARYTIVAVRRLKGVVVDDEMQEKAEKFIAHVRGR